MKFFNMLVGANLRVITPLTICNVPIPYATSVKYLGVNLQPQLSTDRDMKKQPSVTLVPLGYPTT